MLLLRQSAARNLSVVSQGRHAPRRNLSWIKNWGTKRPWQQNLLRKMDAYGGDYVVPAIIGANLVVFACWHYSKSPYHRRLMSEHFMLSPIDITNLKNPHTLFTSFFSHFDGMHLFGNMFTLYFFGNTAVSYLGVARFLSLYTGAGLFSNLVFVAWPYLPSVSTSGGRRRRYFGHDARYDRALGASGAVNAILMWVICTNPKSVIYLYGLVPIPAAILGV
jgi:rhomboid-like protein